MARGLRTIAPPGDWRSFPFAIPSGGDAKVIGTLYLINDTWAWCFSSEDNHLGDETNGSIIAAGKEVIFIYNAEKVELLKETGAAIAVGEKVYVHHVTKALSATNSANHTCIGTCVVNAAAAAALVIIDLKGDSMTDQA